MQEAGGGADIDGVLAADAAVAAAAASTAATTAARRRRRAPPPRAAAAARRRRPEARAVADDGTSAASVGVVAGDVPRCFSGTTLPDDSFMWHRSGVVKWPDNDSGEPPALGALRPAPLAAALRLRSGDRVGVLVDLHAGRLGFTRNGRLEPALSRRLAGLVPPLALRFAAGALRVNATWRVAPPARARATLEAGVDWARWTAPPPPPGSEAAEALEEGGEGPEPGPEEALVPLLPPDMLASYRAFMADQARRDRAAEGPSDPDPEA
jgi:hypothetical protein